MTTETTDARRSRHPTAPAEPDGRPVTVPKCRTERRRPTIRRRDDRADDRTGRGRCPMPA